MTGPSLSVVLPTYRRTDMLDQCLTALRKQTVPAIEIVVGRRCNDTESAEVIAGHAAASQGVVCEAVVGEQANLVASMNAALARTTGDLVALTDDDAEAPADWLEKIAGPFADPAIGGVGGRDWQPRERGDASEVGILRWWGKVIGNHHLGAGPARDVDLLKGVNCCFRGDLLRDLGFDQRLKGVGNVSHWEMHLCFTLRREGWRLVYDPAIRLDHHIAVRVDGDVNARGGFARAAFEDAVHNGTLALLDHFAGPRRTFFLLWKLGIGTRTEPGVLQTLRLLLLGRSLTEVRERFFATRAGVAAAKTTWKASSHPITCSKEAPS